MAKPDLLKFIDAVRTRRDYVLQHATGLHASARLRQAALVTMFLDWFVHQIRINSWALAQKSGADSGSHSPWHDFHDALDSLKLVVNQYDSATRIARGTLDAIGVDLTPAAAPVMGEGGNAAAALNFLLAFEARVRSYVQITRKLSQSATCEANWTSDERREHYTSLMNTFRALTDINDNAAVRDFLFVHSGELDSISSIEKMRQRLRDGEESAFAYVRKLCEEHVGVWIL